MKRQAGSFRTTAAAGELPADSGRGQGEATRPVWIPLPAGVIERMKTAAGFDAKDRSRRFEGDSARRRAEASAEIGGRRAMGCAGIHDAGAAARSGSGLNRIPPRREDLPEEAIQLGRVLKFPYGARARRRQGRPVLPDFLSGFRVVLAKNGDLPHRLRGVGNAGLGQFDEVPECGIRPGGGEDVQEEIALADVVLAEGAVPGHVKGRAKRGAGKKNLVRKRDLFPEGRQG